MQKQTIDITENGATRLMAALAAEDVRDFFNGADNIEDAKKSLQMLLEIIAVAVPNVPTSDDNELAKSAHNSGSTKSSCLTCKRAIVCSMRLCIQNVITVCKRYKAQ